MTKIDYKKELKTLYRPAAKKVVELTVPQMRFLMVDGKGEPGSEDYGHAVEALYSVAYTLKFMIKRGELAIDYGVLPLEGLWWAEDLTDFVNDNRSNWIWTMMIMQPDLIRESLVAQAIEQVKNKKNLPAIDRVKYESYSDGLCAQNFACGAVYRGGANGAARA